MDSSLAIWIFGIASTVVGAWALRFGYTVVFGESDKQLRSFLLKKRSGWKRRRYIRAFVSAARGHTVIGDALVTVNTQSAALAAFCMTIATMGLIAMTEAADSEVRQIEAVARVDGLLSRLDAPAREQSSDELRAELKDMRQALRSYDPKIRDIKRGARLMFMVPAFSAVAFIFAGAFWGPVFIRKRIFAFEIERFVLRMQGLANAEELATLALLESRVSDEASLRRFIDATKGIAEKHSVPQLAARFDLWSDEESPGREHGG